MLCLGALPLGSFGGTDVRGSLQDGDLDILIQDDTMIDYFKLDVQQGATPTGTSTWGSLRAHYR